MTEIKATKHIGIVGCSAEGAALCYKTICINSSEMMGEYAHPEVSMHTHSLSKYVAALNANDMVRVSELMLSSANKLCDQGADFLICPDNTIHQAFHLVEKQTPLPWLHIAQTVAEKALRNGHRKLGILGTQWLLESSVYPDVLDQAGILWERPARTDRIECGRIIMEELVHGMVMPISIACYQTVIERLAQQGCDAVVLGCTEIPLLLDGVSLPIPALDSNRILAEAAIAKSVDRLGPD